MPKRPRGKTLPATRTDAAAALAAIALAVAVLAASGCAGAPATSPRTSGSARAAGGAATSGAATASGSASAAVSATAPNAPGAAEATASAVETYPATAKVVALTFDDGPNTQWTPRVLAALKKEGVRGTFFMVGQMIQAHPAAARKVAEAGMLVASHSESHHDYRKMSDALVRHDLKDAKNLQRKAGVTARYFRFPFGSQDARVKRIVESAGLSIVGWGIDSGDWEKPPVTAIVNNVVKHAKPGAIILMHDGGGDRSRTVAALPQIVRALRAKGYTFVTVDQLAPQLLSK